MSADPTNRTTARLPQDLRALGYPVCDRAADEIERLRKMLPPHSGLWFHEPDGTVRAPRDI